MNDRTAAASAGAQLRRAARGVRNRLGATAEPAAPAATRPGKAGTGAKTGNRRGALPDGVAQMLGKPGGRTVSIVAHPRCARAVRPWLRRLAADDTALFFLGGPPPPGAPGADDADVAEDLEDLTVRLARRNTHALLVVLVPSGLLPQGVDDHYGLLSQLMPQLSRKGVYVVDRSVEQIDEDTSVEGSRNGLDVAPGNWDRLVAHHKPGSPTARFSQEELNSRMVRALYVSREVAVISKRGVTPFKLREDETGTLLPEREPGVQVDVLDTRPGGSLEVAVAESSYGPSRAEPWPDHLDYPEMQLRHYQGDLVSRGGMLLRAGSTLLPESFRWPLDLRLGQPNAETLSNRFAYLDPKPAKRRLDGDYYFLDCVFSGHFGHLTTEVLCRLWGWEKAKQEIPDLKALFHTRPWAGKNGDLERKLFTAYGIKEEDLVASDVPVRLRSVVGASPMWHNQEPHYVHPDIRETWAKMTAGLLGDRPASEHERIFVSRGPSLRHRRGCHNQEEVEQLFADRGYHVFYPEELPLPEQVALFAGARVVAGFGGSALFNLMHTRRLEAVVVLSSRAYVARNEHMFTSLLGGELHYFWGPSDIPPPKVGRTRASDRSSWTLELDDVGADLDRVLRTV